jgi:hypothetical protein
MGYPIQSQTIWVNGELKEANYLTCSIFSDDLKSVAIFFWQLQYETTDENGNTIYPVLVQGNVAISGENYDVWGTSADINYAAYQYVASELNLQLA